MAPQELTVRVYGFLIDRQQNVLVSDEIIQGKYYTKLPGGGLELGEGTRECLAREFGEEAHIQVNVGAHIYTTDYFQPSFFGRAQQFMGIYYLVQSDESAKIKVAQQPFDFAPAQIALGHGVEVFRWLPLCELSEDVFSLPTDKKAVIELKKYFGL